MPLKFGSLKLSDKLLKIIGEMGFNEMTPIQAVSIPVLLANKDLIGQSQTGSGKTAAFIIPTLQNIDITNSEPQVLVLCPTRELCDQVLREFRKFAKAVSGVQMVALVGGQPYPPQIQALKNGVHIVVGTPGRTLEHIKSGQMFVDRIKTFILDEADRMLEEGFEDEMTAILERLPETRQTVFFSATFPESIEKLSQRYQKNAERISVLENLRDIPLIEQFLYHAENPQKIQTLIHILQRHPSMCTLIFCRTKATVNDIGRILDDLKVRCEVLHGDLEQSERDRAIALFRNGSLRALVATDVAARGLDIDSLQLVVNVDLPSSPEIYIHRIGRTGRAGRTGAAVSIATAFENDKIREIESLTGVTMICKVLEEQRNTDFEADFKKTLMYTSMKSLQIFAGRSNKIRPGDILGALTAKPDPIAAANIGKIQILDRFSFVAITPDLAEKALNKMQQTKIKGTKYKVYLV